MGWTDSVHIFHDDITFILRMRFPMFLSNGVPGWQEKEPLELQEFGNEIDTRGGYLCGVAQEPSIFQTIHIDTIHMTPASNECKYIVHGHCALSLWMGFFFHVMWSDQITICKQVGCSLYFMVTEAHPIILLDLAKATWLVELPEGPLSTEKLIGYQAQALAKHSQHIEEM
ncbi:hypothetical protein J132_00169 [Termitomyces sp. J132]|nr:hypothetical protein J132_00169 [Termitomyces sp. J132]